MAWSNASTDGLAAKYWVLQFIRTATSSNCFVALTPPTTRGVSASSMERHPTRLSPNDSKHDHNSTSPRGPLRAGPVHVTSRRLASPRTLPRRSHNQTARLLIQPTPFSCLYRI